MDLFTKNHDNNWERIVHLLVQDNDDLSTNINDKNTCKVIFITGGNGLISIDRKNYFIFAPALICLNPSNYIKIKQNTNLESTVVYFKPEVVNDNLTNDKLILGYYNNMHGTTIYQDLILLKSFYCIDEPIIPVIKLSSSSELVVRKIITSINLELTSQYDCFWPCRSRSYFIELLFHINLSKKNNLYTNNFPEINNKFLQDIICYLNEHISEKIYLNDLEKKFTTNRNKINSIFKDTTGLTCMKFLLKIRIDLAKLLISNTDLPISEICVRTGFEDSSYFTKLFKKEVGKTPTEFKNPNQDI